MKCEAAECPDPAVCRDRYDDLTNFFCAFHCGSFHYEGVICVPV